MPGTLIIICGLPGSGKTTRAKNLESSRNAVRFSADDWMAPLDFDLWNESSRAKIEALQWNIAQRLLTLGQIVVIEWGTWARSEREALRQQAQTLGTTVELHFMDAPIDVLFDRIQRRAAEHPPITRLQVEQWAEVFEPPTADEAAAYDSFSRGDEESV